jgi:RNA polymerase sigma-70 factor (ECF subfamily)
MRTLQPDIVALPELLESNAPEAVSLEAEVGSLFDTYRNPLLRFLLSLGLTGADGEEVIQEVFLGLFQHLRAGKPRDNLRGWLFQVGHNRALKWRQRRPAPILAPATMATPEELAIEKQTRRLLAAVIRALPEQERACLALRAEGLRYREIAGVLGISLGGVALSLERALTRIQRVHER